MILWYFYLEHECCGGSQAAVWPFLQGGFLHHFICKYVNEFDVLKY